MAWYRLDLALFGVIKCFHLQDRYRTSNITRFLELPPASCRSAFRDVETRRKDLQASRYSSIYVFSYAACSPIADYGLLILEVLRDHTQRHTTADRTPLDEWSARRRDLYLTTHNTHNRHPCPGGIRTHNLSRRVAAHLRLRPRGHCDRHSSIYVTQKKRWMIIKHLS